MERKIGNSCLSHNNKERDAIKILEGVEEI